jgi:hypothetical protein
MTICAVRIGHIYVFALLLETNYSWASKNDNFIDDPSFNKIERGEHRDSAAQRKGQLR